MKEGLELGITTIEDLLINSMISGINNDKVIDSLELNILVCQSLLCKELYEV